MYHVPRHVALADMPELADLLIGRVRIVIAGDSMAPALQRGDAVIVEPLQGRVPQPGDIIVYERGAQWICHRVVRVDAERRPPCLVTQGDAVTGPDAPTPLERVLGRVVRVVSRRPRWRRLIAQWRQRVARAVHRAPRSRPVEPWMPSRSLTRAAHPLRDLADRLALPLDDPRRARPLTREERVLHWSVWIDEATAQRALAPLVRAPLDWWFILQQARQHGVSALLYDRLRRLPPEIVPAGVLSALRQGYYHAAAVGARHVEHARAAARQLSACGVRVVALKGLGMIDRYYRDAALRPMGDVDFLVAAASLPRVDRCLRRAGYERLRAPQAVYAGSPDTGGLMLDMHPPEEHPFYDLTAVLARAQPAEGAPYALPTPEDMLLFSGLHTTLHHVWMRLIWIHDLARIIHAAQPPLDWSLVCARLRDLPGRIAMAHALRAARDVCGAAVPPEALEACAPQRSERGRAAALAWLLAHPPIPQLGFVVMYALGRRSTVSLQGFRRRLLPSRAATRQRSGARTLPQMLAWHAARAGRLTWRAVALAGTLLRYAWHDWRAR